MATVQKRLHISGLTPSITENDIRTRLEKFIDVKAIDGFGKLNALGEPRKFAYATVDATEQNLARCLNHLSGTVWKGAKLRIGEAKPDYTQRLKIENEQQEMGTSKKRTRPPKGVQGVHAKDMSPVTLANADSRPGWHKTPLLHLIRPMKMRPSRPLPTLPSKLSSKMKSKNKRNTLSRAKIQKIDPKLWNSVHVTEKMLQSIIIAPSVSNIPTAAPILTTNDTPFLNDDDDDDDDGDSSTMSIDELIIPTTKLKAPSPSKPLETQTSPRTATEYVTDPDIQQENSLHLKLLSNMFASDWNGRETVQDDSSESEDADGNIKAVKSHEEISLSRNVTNAGEGETQNSVEDIVMGDSQEPESSGGANENRQRAPSPTSDHPTQTQKSKEKSLKDLFKPQEDTNFSLMAGLDLDLDLELELDPAFDFTKPTIEPQAHTSVQTESVVQPSTFVHHYEGLKLDPSLPLFFPQPDDPRSRDIVTFAKDQGWQFYRTDESEAIHKRWDEIKGGLTHDWKKRSREAVKARKRRFGAEAIEEL